MEKGKLSEALVMLSSIDKARDMLSLERDSTSTPNIEDLPISIPGTEVDSYNTETNDFRYRIGTDSGSAGFLYAYRLPLQTKYALVNVSASVNSSFTGEYCCWYDAKYKKLCSSQNFTLSKTPGWYVASAIGCMQKIN